MKEKRRYTILILPLVLSFIWAVTASGTILVQCPGDTDGDLIPDQPGYERVHCMHIGGGDGMTIMADGYDQYTLGFALVQGPGDPPVPDSEVIANFTYRATWPAPIIVMDEGDELYLTMTNVGMLLRPDLFDPHTVHWHGFPNAAPIFDGLPEPSPSANMGTSFVYYYHPVRPGTYFYHCHVEASEHMQMGMLGNLYVRPAQNKLPDETDLSGHSHLNPTNGFGADPDLAEPWMDPDPLDGDKYVYNDGDGSTLYDVEYPLMLGGFDSRFHDASLYVQPLPFADMDDNYQMLNGRGYPDTINPDPLMNNASLYGGDADYEGQKESALITATQGEKILLRIANISTTDEFSIVTTLGVPMKVVGQGADLLRGPGAIDLSYEIEVLHTAGGEQYDVIIDTTTVAPGTYFLYTTNGPFLTNNLEERGGVMTEIVIL